MKTADFKKYKAHFLSSIRQVWANSKSKIFYESAFPAYSNANPLINYLFWQRIRIAINYIERNGPYELALDFGCGSGVMLPFLAGISRKVIAVDIDLSPIEQIKSYTTFPDNIEFQDAGDIFSNRFPNESFNIVIALDVLEHVDDLDKTIRQIRSLLKPGGRLVVSAPTENIFYKIGRRIAGTDYTGEFHERGSREIKQTLSSIMKVKQVATLYYPVPLFEIFVGTV
jgi:2-polyprenyl-3-methyl-5-hydroxy-6-metoxy-1,4-benzoquinol methylase